MLDFLNFRIRKHDASRFGLWYRGGSNSCGNWFKPCMLLMSSEAMIAQARKKLNNHSHNLKFVKAGFLSYKHEAEPVDVIMTRAAFHHLPDFWKQIALLRMNNMLKMDGITLHV